MVAVATLGACTCNDLAGPGPQLGASAHDLAAIRALPEAGVTVDKLEITRVTPEPELSRVVFSYALDGRRGDEALVAVGVERQPMVRGDHGFVPRGEALPALRNLLAWIPTDPAVARDVIRVDVDQALVTRERRDGHRQALTFHAGADAGFVPAP